MSDYLEYRIEKPNTFKIQPLKSGRGKRTQYVIGFDSEADTRTGRPMLMQFSLPEHKSEAEAWLITVPENEHAAGLRIFSQFIRDFCTRKDTEYIIYGWNIEYELTQILHDLPEEARKSGEMTIEVRGTETGAHFTYKVFNDKRHLMTITNNSTKRQVRVLDGMSFFKTSLDNAARMLGLGEKYHGDKLPCNRCGAPDRINTEFCQRCTTRDDLENADFLHYARTDAFITRRIGEYIADMHESYDVTTCISAPHFASKVFKRRFLRTRIKHPYPELEQAGLWSYHGGKNGFYLTEPTELDSVYQYDITSAYPEAMRQLPNIELADWIHIDYEPRVHAIYKATLDYRPCKYRGMQSHDGKWPEAGYYEDIYLTSYELDEMVSRDEARIIACKGWKMTGKPGGPLVSYVDEFFDLKARSTGPIRETAKLFLNSLYGKFFQKVALGRVGWLDLDEGEWITTDPEQDFDWRAGGLYHPPIASLITGYVRAKIHRLEHKYESLMTSTDGIFGMLPPDPTDLGKRLGDLTVKHGALKIWRERLYIFFPDDACVCDSSDIEHARDCPAAPKWAAHGFRARMRELDAIPLQHGEYAYTGRQMVTLKLSTIGLNGERYEPGRFVELPYRIVI